MEVKKAVSGGGPVRLGVHPILHCHWTRVHNANTTTRTRAYVNLRVPARMKWPSPPPPQQPPPVHSTYHAICRMILWNFAYLRFGGQPCSNDTNARHCISN